MTNSAATSTARVWTISAPDFLSRDYVGLYLIMGGTSAVFTVQFVKNNGELRTITGTLVAPIEGPLGVNVTLMTDEGYKSFNTGAVVSIGFTDGGQG
jgi:hypothetical protein